VRHADIGTHYGRPESVSLRHTKPLEKACQWIDDQLNKYFSTVESLLRDMEVRLVIKSVTYEMLKEPKFQKLVRDAYPNIDWTKPFEEFSAAPSPVQATLGY
jgi:hypothetical protein